MFFRRCAKGADVQFVEYANGGHFTTEILGFIGAAKFVQSAFNGNVAPGCSRSTALSNSLDPVALGSNLEPVLVQLINALLKIGEADSNVVKDLDILIATLST